MYVYELAGYVYCCTMIWSLPCAKKKLALCPSTFSLLIQNTRIWINGRQDAEEGEDEEDDFQPVPVDSWEISPDCIIMDTMLGEGQFGEVYKGLIKDGDVNNPYFKGSECVAVKILRREFCCCCSPCITVCVWLCLFAVAICSWSKCRIEEWLPEGDCHHEEDHHG